MPFYRDEKFGLYHMRGSGLPPACVGPRLEGDEGTFGGRASSSCCRPSVALCDFPTGPNGETCSDPVCEHHRRRIDFQTDLCWRHAASAETFKAPPGDLFHGKPGGKS